MTHQPPPTRIARFAPLLILTLYLLIPYLFALFTGTPAQDASGFARWHSAASSLYCGRGLTSFTLILLAELCVFLLLLVAMRAMVWPKNEWGTVLQTQGGLLFVSMALIAAPFVIGWQTDSSVCTRGRAFFWESILIDTFIMALLAISYNLLFGFSGIVSFGHATFFGMGAYTVGLLMKHLSTPWWMAVVAALLVGVVLALIQGFVGLRIKGLYFALFTLAFSQVFFLLAGNRILVELTGAEDGFTFAVPNWLNSTQNRLGFYYLTLAILGLCYLLVQWVMQSPTGRVLTALRDNEDRAQMLGYNTFHFKLIAIILAGVLAAAAGVLRGVALKGASPSVLSLDYTMTPLLMTIVGGAGTFAGPLLGAFLLHLTEESLRDIVVNIGGLSINIGERWALVLGILFIVMVMVFPQGIVGTFQLWWLRWRARFLRR